LADDAGSLLVRAGLIAEDQLASAKKAQSQSGGTVAEHLVLGGVIRDEDLTRFYMERLLVPRVNSELFERISERLLRLIPADMATEFRVIPVALDREQNLTLAMSDPSHLHAAEEIGFFTGTYVVRAVATQAQIARALLRYYGQATPLAANSEKAATDTPRTSIARRIDAVLEVQEALPVIDPTGPTATILTRPEPEPKGTPVELAPRAGEVEVRAQDRKVDDLPAVLIESGLLEQRTPLPPAAGPQETTSGEIIIAPRKKASTLTLGGNGRPRDPMATTAKFQIPTDDSDALETSSTELVLTFRRFEEMSTKNEVIHAFLDYLQKTFERVAFLVVREETLAVHAVRAARVQPGAHNVSLALGGDSMFQKVIDERTPFRGRASDAPSIAFIESMFGDAEEESYTLPLQVRDVLVGLFYADRMRRSSVPEHISAAARAAGLALERILQHRKFETIPPG
jgi:hypothetical protein